MVTNWHEFVYLDTSTNQVAICPKIIQSKSGDKTSIVWETNSPRPKAVETKSISTTDHDITICTKDNASIHLIKLTLAIYNERVKLKVANLPDFDSDENVQEYFKNINFYRTC